MTVGSPLSSRFSLSRRGIVTLVIPCLAAALAIWPSSIQAQGARQIELTPKLIEQFINAQKQVAALIVALNAASEGDPATQAEAAAAAAVKKHGFIDLDEYEDTELAILAVLDGVDARTKQYSDPIREVKEDIAAAEADKKLSEADRNKRLDELNKELASLRPVRYPGNIKLVLKYYAQLDELFPVQQEEPKK